MKNAKPFGGLPCFTLAVLTSEHSALSFLGRSLAFTAIWVILAHRKKSSLEDSVSFCRFLLLRGKSPVVYHTAVRSKVLQCNRVSWKSHKQRAAPLMHIRHWSIFWKHAAGIQWVFWALVEFVVQAPPANTHGYNISNEEKKGISSLCRHLMGWMLHLILCSGFPAHAHCLQYLHLTAI